jgi:hypothetical protein
MAVSGINSYDRDYNHLTFCCPNSHSSLPRFGSTAYRLSGRSLTSAMRGRRGRREATLRRGPLDRHVRPEVSRRRSQVQRPSLPNVAHQEITGLREKDACDSSPGKLGECPPRFEQDVYSGWW